MFLSLTPNDHCCTHYFFCCIAQSAPVAVKDEPKFKRGTQDLSACVKDVGVDGVEGLNLRWEAPFKFDDYVVGFKLAMRNLKKATE